MYPVIAFPVTCDRQLPGQFFNRSDEHVDLISRVVDPAAANGSPLVYQWRFNDAGPWHLRIDNGSTRAEPGEAANPDIVFESSWADWVAAGKPDANQLKMILQRRLRPRGSIRELARMRKVFH